MTYLTRSDAAERRADVRTSLPQARSVVVAGLNYATPPAPAPHPGTGVVASYARYDDYHDVLGTRLAALAAAIAEAAGHAVARRVYVDTGPLLERELGARAGLGWQGKNTCLIDPRRGSYFLLGEILLDIEIEPDAPFTADRCGSCTRCLDACPTGALIAPRVLDSRACLSYHTIELKGPIPGEYRADLGALVFGCDICQEVCPWNQRFAQAGDDADFRSYADLDAPDLALLLALDDAGFRARFRRSPIRRTKRRGLLRNAAVALGNTGGPEALTALTTALADAEPLVRGHAAWGIGRLCQRYPALVTVARPDLDRAAVRETDPGAATEIAAARAALNSAAG